MFLNRLLSFFGIRASEPVTLAMPANNTITLDQVISTMIDILATYLPPPAPPLPVPTVSVVSATERPLALGNLRGIERRGSFGIVSLKGGRLEAVVSFQLWSGAPGNLDTAINELHGRLMAAKDDLWNQGFLRITADKTSFAEHIESLDNWRKATDYKVLYEFRYQDTDGAESLIARIPIHSDPEFHNSPDRETTIVTDEMVRWDNETASALSIRGGLDIKSLTALSFIPGTNPVGTITLTRTYDGATGPPTNFSNLADFLTSVTNPDVPERHAQVTFASLNDFLNEFSAGGDPVTLGDWDQNDILDSYEPFVLAFDRVINLPSAVDRLDVAYENTAFDQTAILYLRASRA